MLLPFQSYSWGSFGGQYVQPFARIMTDWTNTNPGRTAAQSLLARPKGKRILLFQNAESNGKLFNHPGDRIAGNRTGIWWENGIAATAASFGNVVENMWLNKGDLDFAVFDIESSPSSYTFGDADLAAIYADPRYAALAASGHFPADCRNMDFANRMLFNYGCSLLVCQAIVRAMIGPLYKRYPNVGWCNFADSPCNKADAGLAPDLNNNPQYISPSPATHYAPCMYARAGNLLFQNRFKIPFYTLAWTTNMAKAAYRAKPTAKLMPWLAPRAEANVLDVAHWNELIFHSCCLAGMNLLYFNIADPSALANWRFDNALSQYVAQSRGKVWKSTVLTALTDFDTARYVISAAKLEDNSIVGRITFKPGVNSASFTLGGKTYNPTRPAGGVGAWFHS